MSSSKSRRAVRPYVRKGLEKGCAGGGVGAAARLADAAGRRWGGAKASVDQLEPRKLLFTLTIEPSDVWEPVTGLGTKTTWFGYVAPYLMRRLPDAQDGTVISEEFADENADWTGLIPAIPPNGFFFDDSNIQISYSPTGAQIQLVPGPDTFPPPARPDDLDLSVNLSGNGQVTFSFFQSADPPNPDGTRFAQLTINGLDTTATGTKVELLLFGQVVRTFSGAALAALGTPVLGAPGDVRYTFTVPEPEGFTAIRFSSAQLPPDNLTYSDQFIIDDISYTRPAPTYADFTTDRIFGVQVTFTGPVGASVQILDLYGREMRETIALGIPPNSELPLVTPFGGPIPAFNDGIGQIIVRGTDERSSLTMWGGQIRSTQDFPDDAEFATGQFAFFLPSTVNGLYDDFEQAGFGYAISRTSAQVMGLPSGSGSIIIGSPFARPNTSVDEYLGIIVGIDGQTYTSHPALLADSNLIGRGAEILNDARFRNPAQGIRVLDGATIGSMLIHGLVHGSSRLTGAVGTLSLGTLMGSLVIDGDARVISIASDAGHWAREDTPARAAGVRYADEIRDTRNELIVGRTLGELVIGGRSTMDVTVIGDINNAGRARWNFLEYREKEQIYDAAFGFDPGFQFTSPLWVIRATLAAGEFAAFDVGLSGIAGQAFPFGAELFRNDTLLDAEFVGHNATATTVRGVLGFADPVNTGRDDTDVFAFTAGPDSVVNIDLVFNFGTFSGVVDALRGFQRLAWARIVDADGRVLASHELNSESLSAINLRQAVRMSFQPEHSDVFFLVLNTPVEGRFADFGVGYTASLTGLLPTTFGSYRTGASTGYAVGGVFGPAAAITVQSGSMGLVRVGTGYTSGSGTVQDTTDLINTFEDVSDLLSLRPSSFNVAGNLHGILAGSDVYGFRTDGSPGPQITVGGNLGTFRTGMSPLFEQGPGEGDIEDLHLEVGGTIAVIDVRGAVRYTQSHNVLVNPERAVTIRTGTSGGPGHIGQILVGQFVYADNFNIRTSPGSTIDAFIVGAERGLDGVDAGDGGVFNFAPLFNLGPGSDLRFASFSRIEALGAVNVVRPLVSGTPLTITDDSGAVVTIEIRGGSPLSFGQVLTLPINGSQGVAIARIDATLLGGASLLINGVSPGVASIGRIVVTTDEDTARSQILISGGTQIDVWRIDHIGGDALTLIQNTTPGGDIVSLDVQGVDEVHIRAGNLGRTQVSGVGPRLIGPLLGVQSGFATEAGAAIGLNPASVNPGWNGELYAPVKVASSDHPDDSTLADLGAPFGPRLNGLLVREGDVQRITVSGAVGDVILQGGNLINLQANSDGARAHGAFDGIVGVVYANTIQFIDVGDGLASPGTGPVAQAGIFADNDIIELTAGRNLNPVIRGIIIAANNDFDVGDNGISRIRVTNGLFDGAFIGAATLDSFWVTGRFMVQTPTSDVRISRGDIVSLVATNTNLFRSRVFATNVNEIRLTGGAYDGTLTHATANINQIVANEFRNTTRLGEVREYRRNEIRAVRDIGTISTTLLAGDISDLRVDAQGSLTGGITARNLIRVDLDIDGTVNNVDARQDIRASAVRAGAIRTVNALGNIRSSSFKTAGRIERITSGMNMTSVEIAADGPDGRIDLVRTAFWLTGEIRSSGPIGQIVSTLGDIDAKVTTTNAQTGTLTLLQAAGDARVTLNIASNVDRIVAGRNIGYQGDENTSRAINVRGNLNVIEATTGQIYTDVRVGQGINIISQARVVALPGHDLVSRAVFHAFGRINTVNIVGDFNGSIISESGGIGAVTITDGSFRPGNRIQANDGGIDSVTIVGGHLLGDIISEEFIGAVRVVRNLAGFHGDIGVNPYLSQSMPFDGWRNALPPGVAPNPTFQGANIRAGTNIGLVEVPHGSFWESSIYAGHSITRVFIAGVILNDFLTPGLGGSWIAAGDTIGLVEVNGFVGGALILAGITDLGADGRPGGVGVNADTVQFGRINDIIFRGGAGMVSIAAGMNAGPDGFYTLNPGADGIRGTADDINDDEVADGLSSIGSVVIAGDSGQTTVYADNGIGFTTAGIIRGGPGLKAKNPGRVLEVIDVPPGVELAQGVPFAFQTAAGETGRFTFTGQGRVFWDQASQTLGLINTGFNSTLIVDTDQGTLTDVRMVSNDGASLGHASVRANLRGNSSFYFDAYVVFAEFGGLDTTGVIGAGNDMGTLIVGPTTRGNIRANYIANLLVGSDFGVPGALGNSVIDLLAGGNINILGRHSGIITLKRDAAAINVGGAIDRGVVRSGRGLSNLSAASMNNARVSARNDITTINIAGNVTDSFIYAGADIGPDGVPGTADDYVSSGNIGRVTIGGNFVRSDIAAGMSRGPDGFLGTSQDRRSEGRSNIGTVAIGGQAIGSEFNSQSYRIIATGNIGSVTANRVPFVSSGNMAVASFNSNADPLQVVDLRVDEEARVYTATIQFNQPIDSSTLSSALRISEMRSGGAVSIALAEGTDYTVAYRPSLNAAEITFSQQLTSRALPQTPGVPGPGVFRFVLLSDIIRGQTQNTRIDGNGDGFAAPTGDDFSQDAIVGDAGDKITGGVAQTPFGAINFYGAADLDLVLDNNYNPNGLPDTNKTFTIRGTLGDHPNHDANFFRFAGDADVYKITLRAGQILRLGEMRGNASLAARVLFDGDGNALLASEGINPFVTSGTFNDKFLRLPNNIPGRDSISSEDQVLIKETGTYYLLVTSTIDTDNIGISDQLADITNPTQIPNLSPVAGAMGAYNFTLEVFDDGDTGFSGDTSSGDGARVVPAPVPVAFAGADGVFGTADDQGIIAINGFNFFLDVGPDGIPNTADDVVRGNNGVGITSQRTAGPDGVFGTVHDEVISWVGASIGKPGQVGVPREITPDIDVYHLNNRDPIAPGTRIRATLRLTDLGSNLGVTQQPRPEEDRPVVLDLRGDFQFAIFETSTSTRIDDGLLLAAPSEALPIGGQAQKTLARGDTSYGYDANGDFFIEFIVPGRQGINGAVPATYALYIQGAVRTDYELVILTQGTGTFVPESQNVFIETEGGVINWLESGNGVTTTLAPFSTGPLGFSGTIGNQRVDDYVISRLVSNLEAMFAAANVNIILSTTPASFEGQDFSTVFLTRTNEPSAFAFNNTFGASQRVDAFNVDRNDQAVVFAPSLAQLGLPPTNEGVDALVQSLTASVARRIGELVGLRTLTNGFGTNTMAANSPFLSSPTYRFNNGSAALSNNWDTLYNSHFYLGRQNDVTLLDRILADRF